MRIDHITNVAICTNHKLSKSLLYKWPLNHCFIVPVDMSTVVPSFHMVPMTFFSFTTLILVSFSHWTTIKPIFRNVILSKTVKKRNNLKHERSTNEKYIQRWAPNGVFFVSDHGYDHGIFLELTLASKENPLVFPIAVSREARKSILTFLTGSFSLDDAYLGSMFWWWYK